MSKYLALIALFSLSAGLPQEPSEPKEKYIRITKFVQTSPQAEQPVPQSPIVDPKILELLKQYQDVQDATGVVRGIQLNALRDRLADEKLLQKFPINVNEADASKFSMRYSRVPKRFRSPMPMNQTDVRIDPKVMIELDNNNALPDR